MRFGDLPKLLACVEYLLYRVVRRSSKALGYSDLGNRLAAELGAWRFLGPDVLQLDRFWKACMDWRRDPISLWTATEVISSGTEKEPWFTANRGRGSLFLKNLILHCK